MTPEDIKGRLTRALLDLPYTFLPDDLRRQLQTNEPFFYNVIQQQPILVQALSLAVHPITPNVPTTKRPSFISRPITKNRLIQRRRTKKRPVKPAPLLSSIDEFDISAGISTIAQRITTHLRSKPDRMAAFLAQLPRSIEFEFTPAPLPSTAFEPTFILPSPPYDVDRAIEYIKQILRVKLKDKNRDQLNAISEDIRRQIPFHTADIRTPHPIPFEDDDEFFDALSDDGSDAVNFEELIIDFHVRLNLYLNGPDKDDRVRAIYNQLDADTRHSIELYPRRELSTHEWAVQNRITLMNAVNAIQDEPVDMNELVDDMHIVPYDLDIAIRDTVRRLRGYLVDPIACKNVYVQLFADDVFQAQLENVQSRLRSAMNNNESLITRINEHIWPRGIWERIGATIDKITPYFLSE